MKVENGECQTDWGYRLEMEPHVVFKEVTKLCTNKDHHQSLGRRGRKSVGAHILRGGYGGVCKDAAKA